MWRLIRSSLVPVLCLLIAIGGVSYAFVSSAEDDASGDEIVLQAGTDEDPGEDAEEAEGAEEIKPDKTPKASKTPKPRSSEGCAEGFEGNHGQFVSQSDDHEAAAKSDCGKPIKKEKKAKKAKKDKPAKTEKPESPEEEGEEDDEHEDDDKREVEEDDDVENEAEPSPT